MNLKPILFIFLILLLSGCSNNTVKTEPTTDSAAIELPVVKPNEPVTSTTPAPVQEKPTVPEPESKQEKLVMVDSVEVLILESFPVQYNTLIQGHFRNGCESIDSISQTSANQKITVLVNSKSTGGFCTQALVPFSETISLNTQDLAQGEATLDVNGITATFNIQ